MRIIVTRPAAQAGPLAAAISELGHEPVLVPLLEIQPIGDSTIEADSYDWVVVTSANGAVELARRRTGPLPKVAAIGPGTAEALAEHGIAADLVPAVSTQEGLVAELPSPPGRVLLAAAEGARAYLVEAVGADFVPLYRTLPVRPAETPKGDLVVLASPSAARAFAELRTDVLAVSIGPQTTAAARGAGIEVVAEAETHDLEGLVAAISRAATPR